MKNIYLDNAATTRPDLFLLDNINRVNYQYYGNPSSIYSIGQESKEVIFNSQKKIAKFINCKPEEIIFTSGGTESNNLAIFGALKNTKKNHIITTCIEHPSVLNTMKFLEKNGYNITYLPVDVNGYLSISDFVNSIKRETALISIMYVNNEIGSSQNILEIGSIAKQYNIKFHCDAIQAIGNQKIDVNLLNIDLMSISGHKIYMPKGIGCLYAKNLDISNILYGGHQQKEKRPGTENIGYIYGLGLAIEQIDDNIFDKDIKNYAIKKLKEVPNLVFNGKSDSHIINFRIPGINNELLVIKLGLKGIFVSGGSACNSSQPEPSHVLKSIGLSDNQCKESIRLSLGKKNSKEDVDIFIEELLKLL